MVLCCAIGLSMMMVLYGVYPVEVFSILVDFWQHLLGISGLRISDMSNQTTVTVLDQGARIKELEAALEGVMSLIESGQLVRDISKDHESGFAMRQIPFVLALSKARAALDGKSEG